MCARLGGSAPWARSREVGGGRVGGRREGSVLTIAKLGAWSVAYYVDTARSAAAAALESRAAGGGLGEYYSESETRLGTFAQCVRGWAGARRGRAPARSVVVALAGGVRVRC
ncbi:hypothetical protein EFV83_00080 (plasmid) [Mycobacteroides abscessus]|nr:hypothetical protein EFV83_00080 [Mycobacteroides abscessus]